MKKHFIWIAAVAIAIFSTSCNSKSKQESSDELIESTVTSTTGQQLEATFDTANELVTIIFEGDTAVLKQQPSASGINYKNDTYEYTEWQNEIELLKNGVVVFSNVDKDKRVYVGETLKDAEGEILTLFCDTTAETPTVTISYKDIKDKVLTQNYAWANGGEYEGENLKWTTNDQGGILEIDGKAVNFVAEKLLFLNLTGG